MSFPPGEEGWWHRAAAARGGCCFRSRPRRAPCHLSAEKQANFGPEKLARPRAGPLGPSEPGPPLVFHWGQGEGRAAARCLPPSSCLWPKGRARSEVIKLSALLPRRGCERSLGQMSFMCLPERQTEEKVGGRERGVRRNGPFLMQHTKSVLVFNFLPLQSQ